MVLTQRLNSGIPTSIKEVFDKHCSTLDVNSNLLKAIRQYDTGFITKNTDHVSFMGSALIGVFPVRWTEADRDQWLDDILFADEVGLEDDIALLPSIDVSRRVQSDVVNLSFIYLLYRIQNSKSIMESDKKEGMISVLRIMHYKFISSLLSHYFPYPTDEGIAKATYEQLSMKFDIKRHGSWGALITARAYEILNGIHRDTYRYMRDDKSVLYMVTDIQTRIREVVKAQTKVFYAVKENNGRIVTTSSVMQIDEGIAIRDTQRTFSKYSRYLKDIASKPNDFIRKDLVDIVLSNVQSADPKVFQQTLIYFCANFNSPDKKEIAKFAEESLLYTFNFITANKIKLNDLVAVLVRLKAMYVGSRIRDHDILFLRDTGDAIVRIAANKKLSTPVAAERTALLIYITLRALTMQHYK
jgi:hypothetical protein